MSRIQIRIRSDGTVEAETHGLKGDECLPFIERVAELTDGTVVASRFTHEYHERREVETPVTPEIDVGQS